MISGKHVLVIEDEFLIAIEIESILTAAGASKIGSAATERQALCEIESGNWDIAVTDANLNGRSIELVADALNRKRMPFVIVTGYDVAALPASVAKSRVLHKPFRDDDLLAAVDDLCGESNAKTGDLVSGPDLLKMDLPEGLAQNKFPDEMSHEAEHEV